MVPPQFYSEICANVKTRVLNALLALEQEFGNLDNYGVPVTKRNQKRVIIYLFISLTTHEENFVIRGQHFFIGDR